MPFDDDGFKAKTAEEITKEYESDAQEIFDIINNSPSSLFWQFMKIHILDRYEYETLLETAADMMSITDAVGIFLDKHGIECGLPRRGATKAEGYVDLTANISGSSIVIPENTVFASSRNEYKSDEDTEVPYEIFMTKTRDGESNDYFPSSVRSADNVVEILDEDNLPISNDYWEFDTTNKNNIHWLAGSIAVIVENESYIVRFSGDVTARIEVASIEEGEDVNASIGEVNRCVTYPSYTVTNSLAIEGGQEQEEDGVFRRRLLAAKRRNFTLGKVKNIAEGIQGVRSAKVWQDKGVDQSSCVDWDNKSLIGWRRIDSTVVRTSQAFVPGDRVLSLGRITLFGKAVNDPSDLLLGLRLSTGPTGLVNYEALGRFKESDLDPTITGNEGLQDLNIDLKYNALDKTKTYHFDLWQETPEDESLDLSNNYWDLRLTNEGYRNDVRGALFYLVGSGISGTWVDQGTGVDLVFKTWYNGAAYTVMLAPKDGYIFRDLNDELDGLLDYIDGQGYSPVGIQYVIDEADEIDVDIRGYIYLTSLADFATVRDEVISNIETYLEGLEAGENVVYSRIEYEIMKHPQVWKQSNLSIKRSDTAIWLERDVYIANDEVADLGTRNLQLGPGNL